MDNTQLRHIIKEIQKKEGVGLAEIAAQSGLDRSYLSSFIHSRVSKLVTEKTFGKLAKAYPTYFTSAQQKTTEPPDPATVILPTGDVKRTLADYIAIIELYNKTLSSAINAGLIDIKNSLKDAEANLARGQQEIKEQILVTATAAVQQLSGQVPGVSAPLTTGGKGNGGKKKVADGDDKNRDH